MLSGKVIDRVRECLRPSQAASLRARARSVELLGGARAVRGVGVSFLGIWGFAVQHRQAVRCAYTTPQNWTRELNPQPSCRLANERGVAWLFAVRLPGPLSLGTLASPDAGQPDRFV